MYRNPEHYPDPTAGAALCQLRRKENRLNAEMQKDAIDVAYLLHADPVSIKRSRCLILSFVEGKRHAEIAPEVGYSNPSQVSRAISEGLAQLAELTNELNLS